VLFNIGTLTLNSHRYLIVILQLNPAALYITLIRNALLLSQRQSQPGAAPFNKALCGVWVHAGHGAHATKQQLLDSAHCHYYANPAHFWYYAIAWAVVALVIGFWFFWRAEAKYGRG
jgi:hypothetical protein